MNEDLAKQIGTHFLEKRLSSGMSQSQLASAINTEQPVISRLESGNFLPSMSLLKRIADVYKVRLVPPKLEHVKKQK